MSSFSRACRAALIAVALVVPLAACTGLRPVYQYGEADAERMAVRFGSPASRVEQIIYNELKLRFVKGGPDAPLVTISASPTSRALTQGTITTPASRLEQIIYNELKLRFVKGGPDAPLVTVSASATGRALTQGTITTPASQNEAIVAATVTVTSADGDTLLSVTRTATADYTTSPQAFANQEASEEAQRRAAKLVADTLRLEIYAALK